MIEEIYFAGVNLSWKMKPSKTLNQNMNQAKQVTITIPAELAAFVAQHGYDNEAGILHLLNAMHALWHGSREDVSKVIQARDIRFSAH